MHTRATGSRPHLTKEQDEQRLRGLRALARLIARAHLAAAAGGPAPREGLHSEADAELPLEEERHAE